MMVNLIPIGDGDDLLFALVFLKGDRGKRLHRKDVRKKDLEPVWRIETKSDERIPSAIYHRLIRLYSNEGDTIYFPDCASGKGLVEAASLNRLAVGNEVDARLLARFVEK
jgi:DNA modification methylase